MKILTGKDIREADLHTIEHEPISSVALMERAAVALEAEIVAAAETQASMPPHPGSAALRKCGASLGSVTDAPEYLIIAGKGNNGGDGLAVARLLKNRFGGSRGVSVILTASAEELSADCLHNLKLLPDGVGVFTLADGHIFADGREIPSEQLFHRNTVIIDAVLGSGVAGAVRGTAARAIRLINACSPGCRMTISIDLSSGLPTEPPEAASPGGQGSLSSADIVRADLTLTIEFPKLSLLLPETGKFAGRLRTVHIGLDRKFIGACNSPYTAVDAEFAESLLQPRGEFDHKGTHGHALVIAGSAEYMGAAILCTGAALRSGCGLVSAHIPSEGRTAMLVTHPSAIISADSAPVFSAAPANLAKYSSVAVGPGIGRSEASVAALKELFARVPQYGNIRAMVLDADALNMISEHKEMLAAIPEGSVLTPHIGELSRLLKAAVSCGLLDGPDNPPATTTDNDGLPWADDMQKIRMVGRLSHRLKSVIVVKGAHTMVCSPDGRRFFNLSGNPGMAKGGSGDVLTGLVAGLAARGYDPLDAAILGVWFHGLAGDAAAASKGIESMNAADILDNIRI